MRSSLIILATEVGAIKPRPEMPR